MSEGDEPPTRGTRPRLISLAEAADMWQVEEQAVSDWIEEGLISSVTTPSGEHRIQVLDEQHERSPGRISSLRTFQISSGVSEEAAARFVVERERRRRELELKGLSWTEVDVEAFCALLAERFDSVVADGCSVSVRNGLIYVAGGGVDVARIVADSEVEVEERLVEAAERLLEVASDSISSHV
jgi:hypothetical protein